MAVDWPMKESLATRRARACLQDPKNANEIQRARALDTNNINILIAGGEGGIRTHGTVTRTTVFEFYDSGAAVCRAVANRAVLLAIFLLTVLPCDVLCRPVSRGWFAIWFAILPSSTTGS